MKLSRNNIRVRRVEDPDGPEFRLVAEIYTTSFPSNETRPVEKTRLHLESDKYRLYVAEMANEVVAFALVYDWGEFALLDYMAVSHKRQRLGIGGAMFRGLVNVLDCGILLLEVQKPDGVNVEKTDRLRFYKRLGAAVVTDSYLLPSYDGEPEEMCLMSVALARRQPLSRGDLRRFVQMIYRDVYGYTGTDLVERTMRSVPDVVTAGA